ncbi:MAG: cyclic nucleotide-binding domain-containing protein [Candidatus Delongbacteria bacterium]|nr:cyclic nucleotide-binding domain-containing protein [Candidatus Delongbacteria bacterium]
MPHPLKKCPWFTSLTPEQLTRIHQMLESKTVHADHFLFRQGDTSTEIYILIEGEIRIQIETPYSKRSLPVLREVALVGELSFIDQLSRSASALCHTDCKFLYISRQNFDRLKTEDRDLYLRLLENLLVHISGMIRKSNLELEQ